MKMGSVIVEKEKKVLTMAEYSEREAISEAISKFYYKNPPNFSYGEGFDRGLDRAQRAILDAPAADVAEVVRCKDCKYGDYDSKPNGAMVCLRTNDGFWRKETDFCSYGERREE